MRRLFLPVQQRLQHTQGAPMQAHLLPGVPRPDEREVRSTQHHPVPSVPSVHPVTRPGSSEARQRLHGAVLPAGYDAAGVQHPFQPKQRQTAGEESGQLRTGHTADRQSNSGCRVARRRTARWRQRETSADNSPADVHVQSLYHERSGACGSCSNYCHCLSVEQKILIFAAITFQCQLHLNKKQTE